MSKARIMWRVHAVLCLSFGLNGCDSNNAIHAVEKPSHMPLLTHTVAAISIPDERVWDGVIEAENQATLSAQTTGRVIELPVDVNDHVQADDVLVRLTNIEQQSLIEQAQAGLTDTKASFDAAQAELNRLATLYEHQLVSKSQLDQATARRDSSRAQYHAAQAKQQVATEQANYTIVKAPYSGIITSRHVHMGETVYPGQPLISSLSLDRLRVNVSIPQSDMTAIRKHKEAALILADGRRVKASQVTVFPYADAMTHSFNVRLELPTTGTELHPGMSAKTAFAIGESTRLLIPESALVKRSEVTATYVISHGDIHLRQLRLGQHYGDQVEVLTGLSSGETIALDPVAAGVLLSQQQTARASHE